MLTIWYFSVTDDNCPHHTMYSVSLGSWVPIYPPIFSLFTFKRKSDPIIHKVNPSLFLSKFSNAPTDERPPGSALWPEGGTRGGGGPVAKGTGLLRPRLRHRWIGHLFLFPVTWVWAASTLYATLQMKKLQPREGTGFFQSYQILKSSG